MILFDKVCDLRKARLSHRRGACAQSGPYAVVRGLS